MYLGKNGWVPYKTWNHWDNKLYYEEDSVVSEEIGAFIRHTSKDDYKVANNTYRARLYSVKKDESGKDIIDTENAPTIKPGGRVVFGVIAKVTTDYGEKKDLVTNKAGVVVRKSVIGADSENGVVEPLKEKIGGVIYDKELYKVITDTADVKTDVYTPGIEKQLTQYLRGDIWADYKPSDKEEIFPMDPMRWKITLSNGTNGTSTRGAIKEYTVRDTLPLGLQYDPEKWEENGKPMSNYLLNTYNNKQALPEPLIEGDGVNKPVTLTWKVTYNGSKYFIQGSGEPVQAERDDISIPSGKSIYLVVGTKGNSNSARYGTYVNRADLIPGDQYPYTAKCAGDLNRDADKKILSVYATAKIDIFGTGRTEAWKEIEYKGDKKIEGGTASGNGPVSAENYVLASAGKTVRYSLNVGNRTESPIENLVLIDHLPEPGDTGLVDNSSRQSEFSVTFPKNTDVQVFLGEKEIDDGYSVTYGKWEELTKAGDALPNKYWKPDGGGYSWSPSPDEKDCIRIVIDSEILKDLTKDANLTVSFDAQLPKAEDLKSIDDAAIAWNTFGYAYNKQNSRDTLVTVEPPKVGVKIPTAELYINKLVESPIEADLSMAEYKFQLEFSEDNQVWKPVTEMAYEVKGIQEYTGVEGSFTLSNNQAAHFTVPANYWYRVKEMDAEGFVVKTTEFESYYGDSFKDYQEKKPPVVEALDSQKYHCTFKNIKTSLVLPETGGPGTGRYHKAGMILIEMALALFLLAAASGEILPNLNIRKKEEEE